MIGALRALRPYRLHLGLLAFTSAVLGADAATGSVAVQLVLGAATFAVLWAVARRLPAHQRLQVWTCVGVATAIEVLGSQVWGVYHYRLGDIPLYVPPGHGLVYCFALTAPALPLVRRHVRLAGRLAFAAAATWAAAGLLLLPLVTGRVDAHGALCLPALAYCTLRSPRRGLFAAVFVAVSWLELWGTALGDWTWAVTAPGDHLGQGNPPSAVAGAYTVLDGSVALVILAGSRLGDRLRRKGAETAEAAA